MNEVPVFGGHVDLQRRVVCRNGQERTLTSQEAALLRFLVERADRVVPTDELLREVWGHQRLTVTRAVHNCVYRLRKKIEADPTCPRHLFTEHGEGFRFVPSAAVVRPEPGLVPAELVEPPDTFVGRHDELQTLASRFAAGVRLQTIVGSAGVGKTRLALRFRGDADASFVAVDASGCTEAPHLIAAVRRALGLGGVGQDELGIQLRVSGPHSLVLDNLEQVVDAAAPLITQWLDHAPQLRLLATSRVPLCLRGERVLNLEPLPMHTDARALLLDRTAMEESGLSPEEDEDLRAIIETLDGVPLAMEIAASRLRVVNLSELRSRLQTALLEMQRHERDVRPRHRSLRAALETSWAMLDRELAEVMADLSVFRGVFSREMALGILGPTAGPRLEELMAHSLLQRRSVDGTTHFSMYVAVRSFASERLAERPEAHRRRLAARHAHTFAAMSAFQDLHRAIGRVRGPYAGDFGDAYEWAMAEGDAPLAVQVARGYAGALLGELRRDVAAQAYKRLWDMPEMTDVLRARSLAVSGRFFLLDALRPSVELLDRLLGGCADEPPRIRLHVLAAKSQRLWRVGRLDEALSAAEAAETEDDSPTHRTFVATYLRAHLLSALGRLDEARLAFDQVLDLDIAYPSFSVSARLGRATVAWVLEDLAAVAHHLEVAAAEGERACFPHAGVSILAGQLYDARGNPDAARGSLNEALALTHRRGVHHNGVLAMVAMVGVERRDDQMLRALDWAERAAALARAHQMVPSSAVVLAMLNLRLRVDRPLSGLDGVVESLPSSSSLTPLVRAVEDYLDEPGVGSLQAIARAHPQRPSSNLVDMLVSAARYALRRGRRVLATRAMEMARALPCAHEGVRAGRQALEGELSRGVA